jgi:neuropeptide S receptor
LNCGAVGCLLTHFSCLWSCQTGQLIFLWTLLILIVVGNLAVLVALGMSNTRKSRMNYFIKHLAIAGTCFYF